MTHKIDRRFAPRLNAEALHEIEVFHATSVDKWMARRDLARVATTKVAPRDVWAIVEAKFRADSRQLALEEPHGLEKNRTSR